MAEDLPGINIPITGDYGNLTKALEGATAAAEAGGKSIADALTEAYAAGAANLQEALSKIASSFAQTSQAAEGASAPMLQFGNAAQQIIDRQRALEVSVKDAKEAVQQLKAGYEAGQVSASALATAEQQLKDAISAANTPLKEYGDAAQSIVDRQKQLTDSIGQSRTALAELKAAYEQGAVGADTVKRAEQELKTAIDQAKISGEEQISTFQRFQDASGSLMQAGASITAAITVPIVGIGAAAFQSANEIDKAMDTIRAKTGATGEVMDGLGESFKKVFANVPEDAKVVSEAMSLIHDRTGLVGQPLEEVTTKLVNLGHIMGESIPEMSALATRAFGDWGISAQQAGGKLDEVMRAAQSTGVPVNELLKLVVQFGAPMREFGLSFESSLAIMGSFEKEGVNLQTSLSGLRFALGNFAKAGLDPEQALQAVIEKIKTTQDKTEALSIAFSAFGKRAASDMFDVIKGGRLDLQALTETILHGHDTITQATADTRSWSEQWQLFKNQLTLTLEPLGVTLVQAASSAMAAIKPVLEVVKGLAEEFTKLPAPIQDGVLVVAAMVAAIGPLITIAGGLGFALQGITGALEALGLTSAATAVAEDALAASTVAAGTSAATAAAAESELAASEVLVGEGAVAAGGGMSTFGSAIAGLGLPALAAGLAGVALNVGGVSDKIGEFLDKHGIRLFDILKGWAQGLDAATISAQSIIGAQEELTRTTGTSAAAIKSAADNALAYSKNLTNVSAKTESTGTAAHKTGLSFDEVSEALGKGGEKLKEYDGALTKATHQLSDFDVAVAAHLAHAKEVEAAHKVWKATEVELYNELGRVATEQEVQNRVNEKAIAKFNELGYSQAKDVDITKGLGTELKNTGKALEDITKISLTPTETALATLEGKGKFASASIDQLSKAMIKLASDHSVSLRQLQGDWELYSSKLHKVSSEDLPAVKAAFGAYVTALQDAHAPMVAILEAQEAFLKKQIGWAKESGDNVDLLKQQLAAVEAKLTALQNHGFWAGFKKGATEGKDAVVLVGSVLDNLQTHMNDVMTKIGEDFGKISKEIIPRVSQSLSDLIIDGGKFKDAMIGVFKGIEKEILDSLIGGALKLLTGTLEDIASHALKSLVSGFESLFNIAPKAANAAVDAAKTGTDAVHIAADASRTAAEASKTAAEATKSVSSAASGVASAASTAASSVVGIVGAVGAVVGAVAGIGQFIQGFSQSTDLGHIEENTRKAAIHLESFLNERLYDYLGAIRDWGNYGTGHLNNIENLLNDLNASFHTFSGQTETGTTTGSMSEAFKQLSDTLIKIFTGANVEGAGTTAEGGPLSSVALLRQIADKTWSIDEYARAMLSDLDAIASGSGIGGGGGTSGSSRPPATGGSGGASSGGSGSASTGAAPSSEATQALSALQVIQAQLAAFETEQLVSSRALNGTMVTAQARADSNAQAQIAAQAAMEEALRSGDAEAIDQARYMLAALQGQGPILQQQLEAARSAVEANAKSGADTRSAITAKLAEAQAAFDKVAAGTGLIVSAVDAQKAAVDLLKVQAAKDGEASSSHLAALAQVQKDAGQKLVDAQGNLASLQKQWFEANASWNLSLAYQISLQIAAAQAAVKEAEKSVDVANQNLEAGKTAAAELKTHDDIVAQAAQAKLQELIEAQKAATTVQESAGAALDKIIANTDPATVAAAQQAAQEKLDSVKAAIDAEKQTLADALIRGDQAAAAQAMEALTALNQNAANAQAVLDKLRENTDPTTATATSKSVDDLAAQQAAATADAAHHLDDINAAIEAEKITLSDALIRGDLAAAAQAELALTALNQNATDAQAALDKLTQNTDPETLAAAQQAAREKLDSLKAAIETEKQTLTDALVRGDQAAAAQAELVLTTLDQNAADAQAALDKLTQNSDPAAETATSKSVDEMSTSVTDAIKDAAETADTTAAAATEAAQDTASNTGAGGPIDTGLAEVQDAVATQTDTIQAQTGTLTEIRDALSAQATGIMAQLLMAAQELTVQQRAWQAEDNVASALLLEVLRAGFESGLAPLQHIEELVTSGFQDLETWFEHVSQEVIDLTTALADWRTEQVAAIKEGFANIETWITTAADKLITELGQERDDIVGELQLDSEGLIAELQIEHAEIMDLLKNTDTLRLLNSIYNAIAIGERSLLRFGERTSLSVEGMQTKLEDLAKMTQMAASHLDSALSKMATQIVSAITELPDTLGSILSGLISDLGSAIQGGLGSIAGAISAIQPSITNVYNSTTSNSYSTSTSTSVVNNTTTAPPAAPPAEAPPPVEAPPPAEESGTPQFASGGIMPFTGLAHLEAGELVLTPTLTKQLLNLPGAPNLVSNLGNLPSAPGAVNLPMSYSSAPSGDYTGIRIDQLIIREVKDARETVREMKRVFGRLSPKVQPYSA